MISRFTLIAVLGAVAVPAAAAPLTRIFTVTAYNNYDPNVFRGNAPSPPFDPYSVTFSVTYDPATTPTINANGSYSVDLGAPVIISSPEPVDGRNLDSVYDYLPNSSGSTLRVQSSASANGGNGFLTLINSPFSALPYFDSSYYYGAGSTRATFSYYDAASRTAWDDGSATVTFVDAVPTSAPEPASITVLLAALIPLALTHFARRRHTD